MSNKKHKKNTNPKILILTQIHPINVASIYDYIVSYFSDHNEVFSAQVMALLGELSLKENENDLFHSYRVLNAAFVKNIKAAITKMSPLKPWIFVGNCAKESIKFDYILGIDGGEDFGNDNCFDHYIFRDNDLLADKDMQINYYGREDAEYFFPTCDHLALFLTTIGLQKNKEGDTDGDTTK